MNTAEAARFLRVSEASIRRWSDSGLLGSQRVGRRRERRFRESDLIAFLSEASPNARPLEVNVGGAVVSPPFHLAPLYGSDAGRLRLSIPFLADGIRLDQPTFLVADGDVQRRYEEALRKSGVDLQAAAKRALFNVIGLENGLEESVASLERQFAEILAKGPTLIRVVGETACAREMLASEEEFLRFEEAVEIMFHRYPVAVLCQYDVRQFSGVALLRALKAHPDMYVTPIGGFLN